MRILHTSEQEIGQIYIPTINWLLLTSIVWLVLSFRSSSSLAAAYGIAVTTTMVITTLLAYIVMRRVWKWHPALVFFSVLLFLTADLLFFGANATKIADGGWFPIVIGAGTFSMLSTWKRGRTILSERLSQQIIPVQSFMESIELMQPQRVDGTAVFMTSSIGGIPLSLLHNLKHNKALHRRNVFLTISFTDIPFVSDEKRLRIDDLGRGFMRIEAIYGFKEDPDIADIFRLCDRQHHIAFNMMETSFFLTHETLVTAKTPAMAAWRKKLFRFMSRNAVKPTDFFNIPSNRALELGTAVEM